MNATDHAQPALLYITPCVLVAAVIVSAARKELLQFWNGKVKVGYVNENQPV